MGTVINADLIDEFTTMFRAEHREVRDGLLDLVHALVANHMEECRALLGEIGALAGPHFRYEEEALYPALVPFFGGDLVDKLYAEHDDAIAIAFRLVDIVQADSLAPHEISEAVRLTRTLLPLVSKCDGLSLMAEVLERREIDRVFAARKCSLEQGLDLLAWASGPRILTQASGTPGAAWAPDPSVLAFHSSL